MQATLEAARGAWPDRRLVMVFQPLRYTRTRDCFEDFVHVLSQADAVFITAVFAAGEEPLLAADGRALTGGVRVEGGVERGFVPGLDLLADSLVHFVRADDVVLIMGAGSISRLPTFLGGRQ